MMLKAALTTSCHPGRSAAESRDLSRRKRGRRRPHSKRYGSRLYGFAFGRDDTGKERTDLRRAYAFDVDSTP